MQMLMPKLTLTVKTLLRLTLASFLISIFISILELSSQKEKAYILAHDTALDKVTSSLPALESMLWKVDKKGVGNVLQGLIRTGSIVRAEIISSEDALTILINTVANREVTESQVDLTWSIPLSIEDHHIAVLHITESYDEVRFEQSERLIKLTSIELLKAVFLGILLFFIVYQTITRHLITLANGIKKLNPNDPSGKIQLEKRSGTSTDEIDVLVQGINGFHNERAEEIKRRKEVESGLEEHIVKRTEELTEALQLAEKANQAKSTFLSNMSHELRTPLNAILGFAQLMENDLKIDVTNHQRVTTINRAGRHLLSLINSVLEISRIEAGKIDLNSDKIDLDETLNTIEDLILYRTKEKKLSFKISKHKDVPRYVLGDEDRLKQVLINLIGNAAKYTEKGEISLRILCQDEQIKFEIADTGPGISTEEQKNLFQSFYQTSVGVNKGEGTGLGLAISYEYVQLMGGKIYVESTVNKGSLFYFTLHLPPCSAPESKPKLLPIVGILNKNKALPRILVVEDNQDSREFMMQLLQQAGFEVLSAENGLVAIEQFKEWHPDFIWMDMRMPELNGYDATKEIRKLKGGLDTKIVALTASAFEEDRKKIIECGCDDMLKKPIESEKIFLCMKHLLGIEYEYQETTKEYEETLSQVEKNIPQSQLDQLIATSKLLDLSATQLVINEIRKIAPSSANKLDRFLAEFKFEQIIDFCKSKQNNE